METPATSPEQRDDTLEFTSWVCGVVSLVTLWIPSMWVFSLGASSTGLLIGSIAVIIAIAYSRDITSNCRPPALCVAALLLAQFLPPASKSKARTELLPVAMEASHVNPSPAQRDPGGNPAPEALRVRISNVSITSIPLFQGYVREWDTTEKYLRIDVAIDNLSLTKKAEFSGWSRDSLDPKHTPLLRDSFGNDYKPVRFTRARVVGQTEGELIDPNHCLYDVVVFEKPVPGAKRYYLSLPLSVFDRHSRGTARFTIDPANLVRN